MIERYKINIKKTHKYNGAINPKQRLNSKTLQKKKKF